MKLLEIHIESTDVNKSVEFYKKLFDYDRILELNDSNQVVFILGNGCAFGIWKKGFKGLYDGRGGIHLHYAFQIAPEKYDTYKSRLQTNGTQVYEHDWGDGSRSLYFVDPDDNQGEFMTKDWLGNKDII
ncbi:MAG: hypothetical protein GF315_07775 [candidate division Zixibacteria bacterium]|nr:hypothetical protein [candidate division Zixibacteria bacterium]